MIPFRPTLAFAVATLTLPLAGCDLLELLYSTPIEIPVPMESPPVDIDVSTPVAEFERAQCEDAESYNCAVVQALDFSDDENVSTPPVIPDEFPIEVTITDPLTGESETLNAEEWAMEQGITDDLDLAQATVLDLRESLEGHPADAVQNVSFQNVRLNWMSNSLTFDTLPLDLYVAKEMLEDISDPQALIDTGAVTRVGTIPAQAAESAGESEVAFVENGQEFFTDALRGLQLTVVVALPQDTRVALNDGEAPGTKRKPQGLASVSLKGDLVFTVSAADLLSQVQ